MGSFNTKYKDRKPEETIEILTNFFNNKGYELRLEALFENDIGTWSCHYTLYLNDTFILFSNGKGMNKEYSLASGLAELYERFCNKMPFLLNPFFTKEYLKKQKEQKNYFWDKDEKEISYEEISQKNYFQLMRYALEDNILKEYLSYYCPFGLYEIPCKNIQDFNQVEYFNLQIFNKLYTSTGMAAGNTIEEALNQGLSEIFERYVSEQFYKDIQKKYYCIDYNSLKNQKLKELCLKLSKNFNIYIFDLAYSFNFPVILTVLVNKRNYRIITSFGCFPVFDIALERSITELYQGLFTYNKDDSSIQDTYNNNLWYTPQTKDKSSYTNCNIIPEIIFSRIQYISNYHNLYLSGQYDNTTILTYYKDLCKKYEINFYFYDNSLIDEVKAIQIISNNFISLSGLSELINREITVPQKELFFIYYKVYYSLVEKMINDDTFSSNDFINTFLNILHIEDIENFINMSNFFIGKDHFVPYSSQAKKNMSLPLIWGIYDKLNPIEIASFSENSFFFKKIKKYFTLLKYCEDKTYTNKDIIEFFKLFNEEEITEEEINNCSNVNYLIENIFFKTLYDEYHSERYKTFINSLIG